MSPTTPPQPPTADQQLVAAAHAWLAGHPLDAAGNAIDVEQTWATMPAAAERDDHQWIVALADLVDAARAEPALESWFADVTLWRTLDIGDHEGFQVDIEIDQAPPLLTTGYHEISDSWADGRLAGVDAAVDALARVAGLATQIRGRQMAPAERLAERLFEAIGHIDPRRITAARRGTVNSHSVTIPWRDVLPLIDELEAQFPGALDHYQKLIRETD